LNGVTQSEFGQWLHENKEENAFLPPEIYRRRELAERKGLSEEYLSNFFSGIKILNRHRKTLVLLYGEDDEFAADAPTKEFTCVWLVGPAGIISSSAVFSAQDGHSVIFPQTESAETSDALGPDAIDDDFLEGIWAGLQVEARSAPRSPTKRTKGVHCDQSVPVDAKLSEEDLEAEQLALKKASDVLLPAPISSALLDEASAGARLLIVPVRSSQEIPFAALRLGNEYLIDKYVPMIVPFANGIIDVARQNSSDVDQTQAAGSATANASPDTLVVGNPDLSKDSTECWPKLPHAQQEAVTVAKTLGGRDALVDKSATYKEIVSQIRSRQNTLKYIHFATHGVSDPVNPADGSYLALAEKNLRGADLRRLKFHLKNSPIVVMSACFSGQGKTIFASGIFGLSDFWQKAGASQTVVSLWGVSDVGTETLMEFFAHSLRDSKDLFSKAPFGSGAEDSLAFAMRQLKMTEPDPAIWAAFTVIGDPSE
jgi:CHAT domain-containing protein